MAKLWIGMGAAALAMAPMLADAQALTYRCVGKDGKKYYGQALPPQCVGVPAEVLNERGLVVKRIDPAAEERERQAKRAAAEAAAKANQPTQSIAERDLERRNRALLATYTSVKDVDDARNRALRENAQQAGRFEQKITELKQRRTRYERELATYKKDGRNSQTVDDNIKNVDLEIRVQEELLSNKRKEVDGINAKYDEEKKRYREATAAAARAAAEPKRKQP